MRVAWAFYLVLALGGIAWIGWREESVPLTLFVDPAGWWIDLAAGIGLGLALVILWRLGARLFPAARELEGRIGGILGPLGREEVIALAVFSGVAEELFFRGAVQGSWGWAWATILFAILHTGPGVSFGLWTLFAAVAGGLFGGLMEWRGNLLGPIVAHFLVNALNLGRLAGRNGAVAGPLPASDSAGRDER